MKIENSDKYYCPVSRQKMNLKANSQNDTEIISGKFESPIGETFKIGNGVPDFTWPKQLKASDQQMLETYEKLAKEYEKFASIPFQTYGEDERSLRQKMTDMLNIHSDSKVLEVGCGDGRGSEVISKRLGPNGQLFVQELSPAFLSKAMERLSDKSVTIEFSVANASYLPFPDNYFDAVHHFGGINTFAEIGRSLNEMVRVTKPGGMVVVGDESLGPWLYDSQFGKIMMNSNPLLKYKVPLKEIPVEARNVKLEWVCLGAFFILQFEVGDSTPQANYHIPIPSERGGTHWTRYYGNLEGVSDEAKELAKEVIKMKGTSMHDWLDNIVREAALKELKRKDGNG